MKKHGRNDGVIEKIIGKMKLLDPVLLISSSVLILISLLTIVGGRHNFGNSKVFMQLAMTLVGFILMLLISAMNYEHLVDKFYIPMIIASVALLIITLLFGASGVNDDTANKSWLVVLKLGSRTFMIQPSEFIKITFILTLSKHISLVKSRINDFRVALGLFIHAGAIIGLILLSGDLGVALVYVGIMAIMLFCAGMSPWYFVSAIAAAVIAFPFLWDHLKVYQQERIIVGFNPELDPLGKGFQPLLSKTAITAGGFFGKGIFGGSYYEELPASHTDFIFSTVCEKFGFLGGFVVIGAIVVMVVRMIYIAMRSRGSYASYICVGVAAMIVVQTIENLGMCLAMLPVVGITLPFMSAGGSSVLAIYIMVGLVQSVYTHQPKNFDKKLLRKL